MLGFWDVFCLGVNAIIGSGIFLFPGTLAALTGPASVLAFLTCGLLLVSVALCYAELGGMLEGSGGSVLYVREAFGPATGFAMGFMAWATAIFSWATVASALSSQLGYFHPAFTQPLLVKSIAVACLCAFGAVNYRGIRPGAWTVDALTVAKVLPLVLFVLAALPHARAASFQPFFSGEGRFGYSIFLCLWALQGFEVAPIPAGEVRNARSTVPKAVVASLVASAVFYGLIQAGALAVHPGLAKSGQRPLVEAAGLCLGPWAAAWMAGAGTVSMLGFTAGAALGAPRYLSALGTGTMRRAALDRLHPRFATPHRAIVVTTAAGVLLVVALDFGRLVDLSNLAVVCQYLATCLAFCRLRLARPEARRTFKAPAPWVVGPLGCAVSLWLMTQVTLKEFLLAGALLAAGFLLRAGVERADG
ncbi:MAG TPA: amino acid permease [Elusimicrobiota bacterium]|jgi:amino acid transporter|nr:amino acid permease [Elusimicrobiota bacterium]